ncbi:hypothetical protein CALCODRAFT_512734 [Calocera cornea HHB12733]|uniref:Uncharacterized protein n=1 Tax=Calocera cornea HHB12733 TaxID=1353952 RepID=A0A165CTU1_9BASI|nr:hypothetical protein CALCODRAFT_512734 [Calocera cornea HHB12733]
MQLSSLIFAGVLVSTAFGQSVRPQNITILQPDMPLAPNPLPLPGAASNADAIVAAFAKLGRTTVWNLAQKIKMEGETFEPEGMVRVGDDRFFVSGYNAIAPTPSFNGSIINGTDRAAGVGLPHLWVYSGNGTKIADATLAQNGDIEYHVGGIDYDGEYIWATIAQDRPNSTATLVKIDPTNITVTNIVHITDHLGGVVHDVETGNLHMLGWGSRNASTWNLNYKAAPYPAFTTPRNVRRNPSYWNDYQDCKFLGHPAAYNFRAVMFCSGLITMPNVPGLYNNTQVGGISIVDLLTMVPLAEIPVALKSDLGALMLNNPVDVNIVDGKMRVYFMPDQHNSTMYVFEPEDNSPYEFGGWPYGLSGEFPL